MTYTFSPEIESLVRQGLASGRYESLDEMLLVALKLLNQRDEDLREFKRRLQTRLERLDRGEGLELEDDDALSAFFDGIEAEFDADFAHKDAD
jgi:Arc/MetJ-type ribon-helix-helix transcriptional regulator